MISPVGNNSNFKSPAFKGIVKVEHVLINGIKTTDFKAIDSAVKQLKAVLMRQADTKDTFIIKNAFRKTYSAFDKDYAPPAYRLSGDTRDIMSKVRPKGSQQTFIATGIDAQNVAYSGVDIGRKRALERVSEGRNYGAEEVARTDYREAKDEILDKFYDKKGLHPKVFIYTETDKNGRIKLKGARLENDLGTTRRFDLNPPAVKKAVTDAKSKKTISEAVEQKPLPQKTSHEVAGSRQTIFIPETTTYPSSVSKPAELLKYMGKREEKNQILEELSAKNWDSFEKAQLKKKRKKGIDPNQTDFFGQLFSDVFK